MEVLSVVVEKGYEGSNSDEGFTLPNWGFN